MARPKAFIKEAIIFEKAGKAFVAFQIKHSVLYKYMNWCEKQNVDPEVFLKKFFNLESQGLPQL